MRASLSTLRVRTTANATDAAVASGRPRAALQMLQSLRAREKPEERRPTPSTTDADVSRSGSRACRRSSSSKGRRSRSRSLGGWFVVATNPKTRARGRSGTSR
jgi:hypothetical protein